MSPEEFVEEVRALFSKDINRDTHKDIPYILLLEHIRDLRQRSHTYRVMKDKIGEHLHGYEYVQGKQLPAWTHYTLEELIDDLIAKTKK